MHLGRIFSLYTRKVGEEVSDIVDAVYALEHKLAEVHMSKTDQRDPHKTFNKMTV